MNGQKTYQSTLLYALALVVGVSSVAMAETMVLNATEYGNIYQVCCYPDVGDPCWYDLNPGMARFSKSWGLRCNIWQARSEERRGFLEFDNSDVINNNLDVTRVELLYAAGMNWSPGPGVPEVWRIEIHLGDFPSHHFLDVDNWSGGALAMLHEWPDGPQDAWIDLGQVGIDKVTSSQDYPFRVRYQDRSLINPQPGIGPDSFPPGTPPGTWGGDLRRSQLRITYTAGKAVAGGAQEEVETWGTIKALYR